MKDKDIINFDITNDKINKLIDNVINYKSKSKNGGGI